MIRLEKVKETEISEIFAIVKTALFEYIDTVFGWDDTFQKNRLSHDYEVHWYHWLYLKNKRIGLVCFKFKDDCLHLHLLIIFPEFQGRGLGTLVMLHLEEIAKGQACHQISLSSFKQNKRALTFYEKRGYQKVKIESDFYVMNSPRLNLNES